uniref:Very-long-chain 3-oxoacyl-CoA synthase n=1 Tax=Araucaria cunninghamii TaxID=56994 RepID=A0A0D6QRX1_ARACU
MGMASGIQGVVLMKEYYDAVDERITEGMVTLINVTAGGLPAVAAPTRGLPAVDSPMPMFVALGLYLCAVCGGSLWIRRAGLRPRVEEPLPLRILVFLHNTFCCILSVYMCSGILAQSMRLKYSVWGNAYKDEEEEMAHFIYVFYVSKIFELMDTIIMVLKRNVRQITILHVYHHVSIAIIWWIIARHAPGGDAYFSAAMNSAVHVVMYFYYLLSSILRNNDKVRRKYLFWGKYLTQIQMLQFGVNMVHAYYCLKTHAPYPRFLCKILFYYMISLVLLFYNFYLHKYSKSSAKQGKLE